ncbi:MAG: hypothetical protein IKU90_07310, partial [Clostridia bacterium]|nr:hypothetical protein [Clostridia bacterium]
MLNLYIPRITAMAEGQGGLPSMLTSGTAIVVYIFLILTIIAVLAVVVLLRGRDKGDEEAAPLAPPPTAEEEERETRFCMLTRIEENRRRYGHSRYERNVTLEGFCEDFRNYAAY